MSNPYQLLLNVLEVHGGRLHALLTRLTLRPEVADDLLQELFLKLREADGFRLADDAPAYARRAAIHLAFDWRRRQRKAPVTGALPDRAGGSESPAAALIRQEEYQEILAALDTLPELYRLCLVLHHLDHQPYEAVARQVGKTPHQVRALCAKGIGRLRVCFQVRRAREEASHDDA